MSGYTPLFAPLFLWGVLVSTAYAGDSKEAPPDRAPEVIGKIAPLPRITPDVEEATITVRPELQALVAGHGFTLDEKGVFTSSSGARIHREMLRKAGMDFDAEGVLVYIGGQPLQLGKPLTGVPVEERHIVPTLKGLLHFAEVVAYDPKEVGKTLQAWGVPVAYDGVHLLNPDGTATYYGLMLYDGLMKGPGGKGKVDGENLADRLRNLSGPRLSQTFALFDQAFESAFKMGKAASRPDLAGADLSQAWDILAVGRLEGEAPLKLEGYVDIGEQFAAYREGLETRALAAGEKGDAERKAELERYIAMLNSLERQRYHKQRDLSMMVPSPDTEGAGASAEEEKDGPPPFRQAFLPKLLSALDRLTGEPLTPGQQEALIKSFPMGETVWRMGAHNLWRKGLTGENVKVAVIDTGVGHNPELEGVVGEREVYTNQVGPSAMGSHATHVAGTIHALAPDAEINSYAAILGGWHQERRVEDRSDMISSQRVMDAIDQAVADGNHVVNLSLRFFTGPVNPITRKIEEYAEKGVIFVVSAGNEAGQFGVGAPSNASNALTVGALDVDGDMAEFSTYGRTLNVETMTHTVKKLIMAPGQNIVSGTALSGDDPEYGKMSGTSMAAPHVAGGTALLAQQWLDVHGMMNPFNAGRRIEAAIIGSADDLSREKMSKRVPRNQPVIVFQPERAYERLRPQS